MIYVITKQTLLTGIQDYEGESTLDHCIEYFKDKEWINVDTETTSFLPFDGILKTIQLGDYDVQFVIDAETIDIKPLKQLLESKLLLFQNFAFDHKWLYHHGFDIKNVYDTFLAECILTTGYEKEEKYLGLDDLCKKYLGVEMHKEIRGLINREGLTPRVIKYCAEDVRYLHMIRAKQMKKITAFNLERVLQLENEVVRVFSLMNYNGLLVDKKKWLEVAEVTEANVKECTLKLDDIIADAVHQHPKLRKYINNQLTMFGVEERRTYINWASNDQKKEILRELGYNIQDVSDKTLQRIKKDEVIRELITLSKNQKLSTSFGKEFLKFVNKNTGRIHPEVWQILVTGRISMNKPNCQQIPAHGKLAETIRSCFIARPGYKLVDTDVSGFELRLLAEYSQEPIWLQIFNEGKDLHSELCALTFEIPLDKVKDPFPHKPDLNYRFVQKTINFGLAYGMSEFKLADVIQRSPKEAKEIIDKFFAVVPKLQRFLNTIANTAIAKGLIRTDPYFRRIRWFPKLDVNDPVSVSKTKREAMNTPPQGSNASLIKQCLINLQREIEQNNWDVKLLLTVHDEILAEAREDIAEAWKDKQEEIMKDTIRLIVKSIPVEVESTIATYWLH